MNNWVTALVDWWASLTRDLTPGDWPTFAGSIFAGVAAFAALWTLDKQRRESRVRNNLELRRQASQIAAWIVKEDTPLNGSVFGSGAIRTFARVCNPSGAPIFNLVVRGYAQNELAFTREVSLVPPGDAPLEVDVSRDVFEKSEIFLEIEFVDGSGNGWLRNRKFELLRKASRRTWLRWMRKRNG